MDRLPNFIITEHIMSFLTPKDLLSLGMVNKEFYKLLFDKYPLFQKDYHHKHFIACCLYDMIEFVKNGHIDICSWGFAIIKPTHTFCFEIRRRSRYAFVSINDYVIHDCSLNTLFGLFDSYVVKNWNHIQLHTKCWYKNKNQRTKYMELTARMYDLMKTSV